MSKSNFDKSYFNQSEYYKKTQIKNDSSKKADQKIFFIKNSSLPSTSPGLKKKINYNSLNSYIFSKEDSNQNGFTSDKSFTNDGLYGLSSKTLNKYSNINNLINDFSLKKNGVSYFDINNSIIQNNQLFFDLDSQTIQENQSFYNNYQNNIEFLNESLGSLFNKRCKPKTVFVCNVCGLDLPTLEAFDEHESKNHPNILCSYIETDNCSVKLNLDHLNNNSRESEPIEKEAIETKTCIQEELLVDEETVTLEKKETEFTKILPKKTEFVCTKCNSKFNEKSIFHQHILDCADISLKSKNLNSNKLNKNKKTNKTDSEQLFISRKTRSQILNKKKCSKEQNSLVANKSKKGRKKKVNSVKNKLISFTNKKEKEDKISEKKTLVENKLNTLLVKQDAVLESNDNQLKNVNSKKNDSTNNCDSIEEHENNEKQSFSESNDSLIEKKIILNDVLLKNSNTEESTSSSYDLQKDNSEANDNNSSKINRDDKRKLIKRKDYLNIIKTYSSYMKEKKFEKSRKYECNKCSKTFNLFRTFTMHKRMCQIKNVSAKVNNNINRKKGRPRSNKKKLSNIKMKLNGKHIKQENKQILKLSTKIITRSKTKKAVNKKSKLNNKLVKSSSKTNRFNCNTCERAFLYEASYRKHIANCKEDENSTILNSKLQIQNEKENSVLNKSYQSFSKLNDTEKLDDVDISKFLVENGFQCSKCLSQYSYEANYKKHVRLCKGILNKVELKSECLKEEKFIDENNDKKDVVLEIYDVITNTSDNVVEGNRLSILQLNKLSDCENTQYENAENINNICNEVGDKGTKLNSSSKGTTLQFHSCPFCHMKFTYTANYRKHLESKYCVVLARSTNKETPNKKLLSSDSSTEKLIQTDSKDNKKTFVCNLCQVKVFSKTGLMRHLAYKHKCKSSKNSSLDTKKNDKLQLVNNIKKRLKQTFNRNS